MAKIIAQAGVRLAVDSKGFPAAVKAVIKEAVAGAKQKIDVDVDSDAIRSKISDAVGGAKTKKIKVDIDRDKLLSSIGSIGDKMVGVLGSVFKGLGTASIATQIGPIIGAVGQLSGVLGLLPAAGLAAGAGIATLVIGMQGFGDALKNMGDPKKFNEALKNLSPNAQAAAKAIQGLSGQWKNLRLDVQDALFKNVGSTIQGLAKAQLPVLRAGLSGVATELNKGFVSWGKWASQGPQVDALRTILDNIRKAFAALAPAGLSFAKALTNISVVGSGFLPQLAKSLSDAAARFDTFIAKARETGQLQAWIQGGITAFGQLWTVVKNVASILSTVFGGLQAQGGGFLNTLVSITNQVKAFFESAQGSQVLSSLAGVLKAAGEAASNVFGAALKAIGPVIVNIAPFVQQLVTAIGQHLVSAIKVAGPILAQLAKFLSDNASWLVPVILGFTSASKAIGLANSAFNLIKTGVSGVSAALSLVGPIVSGVTTAFGFLGSAFAAVGRAIPILMGLLRGLFTFLLTNPFVAIAAAVIGIAVLIITNWDSIKQFLTDTWNSIVSIATTVWNAIASFFTGLWNTISSAVVNAWNAIGEFFSGLWQGIWGQIQSAWNTIKDFFAGLWQGIWSVIQGAWNGIKDFFTGLWQGIWSVIQNAWNQIKDFFAGLWQGIWAQVTAAWNGIKNFFSNLWSNISSGIHSAWDAVVGFFGSIPGRILGALGDLGSLLLNAGKKIIEGFLNGLKKAWDAVTGFIGGIGKWIGDHKGPISYDKRLLIPAGNAIMEGLLNGLQTGFDPVMTAVSGMADQLVNAFGSPTLNADVRGGFDLSAAQRSATADALAAGGAAVSFNQTNVMQPGTDARQFADTVSQRKMSDFLSGGSTLQVNRNGVQFGVNDLAITGVRL